MKQHAVESQIKILVIKALGFEMLILCALIILATQIVGSFKRDMANGVAKAYRYPLISGDTRYVTTGLINQLEKDYNAVQWQPVSGDGGFVVPNTFHVPAFPGYSEITVRIFSDESRRFAVGTLRFFYSRWVFVAWAVYAWLFLFLISLPLIFKERKRLIQNYEMDLKCSSQESLGAVAAQVAHDIRSPLAALEMMVKDTSQLPEEKRIIIRSAVGRIRDIANNLIEQNRQIKNAQAGDGAKADLSKVEPASSLLISSLIEPLITEKRLQFRSQIGIEIEAALGAISYGLFAKVQPTEFKRVISNLINNSVEALGKKGSVLVKLTREAKRVVIKINDNGAGIAPEILSRLGQKGETHGKAGGSGLGLYHAKAMLESWGGDLAIESERGKGTTVSLTLPVVEPPVWFVSALELEAGSTIVVLDDDTSIHQIWDGRFAALEAVQKGLKILHFSTPETFRTWVKAEGQAEPSKTIYLADYELLGYKETGLSLIEELGLGKQAILVTSRYEEQSILSTCLRLGVRMIPKGLAAIVPISIAAPSLSEKAASVPSAAPEAKEQPKAVLLDDDALVHLTWKMAAKNQGVDLRAFKKPGDLLAALDGIDKSADIYLDSELGDGEKLKGEDIAKILHEKGFLSITMETGHEPSYFAHLTFLKKIQSKEPPWN